MIHYVYVHRYKTGKNKGDIFYVGKGTGKRLYSSASRNAHWHNINKKYGRSSEIIAYFLTASDALDFEVIKIKEIGVDNLCNKSDGGDSGFFGCKHTDESKRKISEFMVGEMKKRMSSDEFIHPCKGRVLSKESRALISASVKSHWDSMRVESKDVRAKKIKESLNTPESIKLRSEINSGKKNPAYDHKIRVFEHESGIGFVGTQHDLFCKKHAHKGNLSAVVLGKRKSTGGWRYVGEI